MKRIFFALLLLALILLLGCGQSDLAVLENDLNIGTVRITIDWPSHKGMQVMRIPESTVTISISVTADDMDPETMEIIYPQTVGTLEVKVGLHRVISAVAKNTSGQIVASGEVSGVQVVAGTNTNVSLVLEDIEAPETPAGLVVSSFTSSEIALTWTANTDPDLAGYNIYLLKTFESSFSKINSSLVTSNMYTDTAVYLGPTYYYKITAVDAVGNESAYTGEVFVDLSPPSPFSILSPTDEAFFLSGHDLIIEWEEAEDISLSSYNVYIRDLSNNIITQSPTLSADTTSWEVSPVLPGDYYIVWVVATDQFGNHKNSNATFIIDPFPPAVRSIW